MNLGGVGAEAGEDLVDIREIIEVEKLNIRYQKQIEETMG